MPAQLERRAPSLPAQQATAPPPRPGPTPAAPPEVYWGDRLTVAVWMTSAALLVLAELVRMLIGLVDG